MSMAEAVRAAVQSPPAAPPPAAVTAPPPAPVEAPVLPPEDLIAPGPDLWIAARNEYSSKFPLQGAFAAEASFLSVSGRHFTIGIPEIHRMAATNLERPSAKIALEDILHRLSGQKLSLKIEVSADIEPAPAPEVSAPPPPDPAPVAVAEKLPPKQAAAAAAAEAAATAAQLEEEFRNDPLIQEALRLFDAKITKSA